MYEYKTHIDKAVFAMQCATDIVGSTIQGHNAQPEVIAYTIKNTADTIFEWLKEHDSRVTPVVKEV